MKNNTTLINSFLSTYNINTYIKSFKRGLAFCNGEGLVNNQVVCKAEFNLILTDELKTYNLKPDIFKK